MKKFTQGFTLIEMLIVVAVIAILAGIVLTGVTGFQATARDTRRIGDLRNTQNLLELYFNACGHYPGGATCAVANTSTWAALTAALVAESTQIPKDPISTKNYYYGVDSTNNLSYVLGATLEKRNNALNSDIDGPVNGVDCNDPVYCIQS